MNANPNGLSSRLFSISYAGHERSCPAGRNHVIPDVLIDNNLQTGQRLEPHGSLHHLNGKVLPASTLAFIHKQVVQKTVS